MSLSIGAITTTVYYARPKNDRDRPKFERIDLNNMYRNTQSASNHWFDIGLSAGLTYPELETIKTRSRGNNDKSYFEMLEALLYKHYPDDPYKADKVDVKLSMLQKLRDAFCTSTVGLYVLGQELAVKIISLQGSSSTAGSTSGTTHSGTTREAHVEIPPQRKNQEYTQQQSEIDNLRNLLATERKQFETDRKQFYKKNFNLAQESERKDREIKSLRAEIEALHAASEAQKRPPEEQCNVLPAPTPETVTVTVTQDAQRLYNANMKHALTMTTNNDTYPLLLNITYEALFSYRNQWELIGTRLNQSSDDLTAIDTKCMKDPSKCFREMLSNFFGRPTGNCHVLLLALVQQQIEGLQGGGKQLEIDTYNRFYADHVTNYIMKNVTR